MNSHFYAVKCLTNLHMGSGDTNFNIVDNEVQKDPVTQMPIMHSSGIKGALRDHFRGLGTTPGSADLVTDIFGSERLDDSSMNMKRTKPGILKFLSARLVCIPVRSGDKYTPYYIATSVDLLREFGNLFTSLCGNDIVPGYSSDVEKLSESRAYYWRKGTVKVEDHLLNVADNDLIGTHIRKFTRLFYPDNHDQCKLLIVPDTVLRAISLPVLARNQLNNGISRNLWYEEVVPHGAVFVFGVLSDNTSTGDQLLEKFHDLVKDQVVQFGGNASIGCGLSKMIALS